MPKAVQVGELVINMAADIASLKTSLAEGVRESKTGADKMAAELAGIKKGFQEAMGPLQDLTIKIGSLESNLNRARDSALSLGKGLLLGAAAGMSIDAITNKINGVIDSMAHLKELSEKTGASVENLSKLSFYAKAAGTDVDSVASAMNKLTKGTMNADDETKGAGHALAFLGLSARDAADNMKDPAVLFTEIAKKLDTYRDGAGKTALAMTLFGKSGADMLPVMKEMAEQGDIAVRVTTAQALAADQYQKDLAKLNAQKNAVFKTIATALLPTMTDFANAMLDVSKKTNMTNDAVKGLAKDDGITEWADTAAMGAARLVDVIMTIPRLLKAVTGSFKVVGADINAVAVMAENSNPLKAAWKKLNGGDPLGEIRQAVAERNKILADANQAYSDLWNYDGAAMEKAMAARIAARKANAGAAAGRGGEKETLNYSTADDANKGGPKLASLIAAAQAELDGEKSIYEARMKMLDLYHSKFGQSDADFYAGRAAARADYIAAEAVAYAKESSMVLAAQAKARSPDEVTAAKEKYNQLASAHRQFLEAMRDAGGVDVANELADSQKQYDDMVKAMHDAGVASLGALDQQIAKQREHNAEIGKTKEQIELAKQAQVDLDTKQLQSDADFLRDGLAKWDLDEKSQAAYKIRLSDLDAEIAKRRELSGLYAAGAEAEAGAKAAASLKEFLDPTKAQSFGDSLRTAFGSAGDSLTKLIGRMQEFGIKQAEIAKGRADADRALKAGQMTQQEYLESIDSLGRRNARNQMASYGDMASAAAGFFGEHSRGYQALTAISQAFHAAELAMTMAELVPKAISAVLTQGQGDPYTAFGRMAAMGALVAGLGVAIGGIGGADTVAKDRQAAQGTGTVLGDKDAKSDSLKRSLELIERNTYQDLTISTSMLDALRSIESNITSFASQLVRTTDIGNPDIGALNSNNGFATTALTAIMGGSIGLTLTKLIPGLDNVVGKIATSIFGGKQSVSDSGFKMDATSLASILDGGAQAYQYADIKTSGGWFGSDKHSERSNPLSDAANRQFTAIIASMSEGILAAGEMLGLSGDDFTDRLNSFVVDIGHVSLKDLKGDELQKAVEAVFSKLGDDMALYAVAGLQDLQQVGEGYLETLARVASEYQAVDVVFQSFGKTFGEVGLASIAARDHLVQLAGGLDKFTSQGEYFLKNFFSEKEQAAALRARIDPTLAQYGLSSSGEKAGKMFRDFIVGLDTTTEEGAKAYTVLMAIAPLLKQVVGAESKALDERKSLQDKLDELTMTSAQLHEKERAAVDASNLALYDRVAALQAEKDAVQSAKDIATGLLSNADNAFAVLQRVTKATTDSLTARITAEKALSDAVKSTLASMKAQGSEVADRAAARAQVQAALAIAKASGVLPDAATLQKSFGVLSQDASSMFSTQEEYLKDFYSTQRDIADLGGLADRSLSVDQLQLDSLNNMLATQQQMLDRLKGIDVTGLTIAQALAGFQAAAGAAQANPIVSGNSAIVGLYRELLGRAPDQSGLQYWQDVFAHGASLDAIRGGFLGSDEYKDRQRMLGVPGFAGGGFHGGGWRIVGEKGPELEATGPSRIFNASQTAEMFGRMASPSSNADVLAAAVDRLNATVERQNTIIDAQGRTIEQVRRESKRQADFIERLTNGGESMPVKVVS